MPVGRGALVGLVSPVSDRPSTVPAVTADLRAFDPPRAVEVQLDDGRWVPGLQAAWLRSPGGPWRASVSYSLQHDHGRGTHLATLPPERVRVSGQ